MTPVARKAVAAGGLIGGVLAFGIGLTWYLMGGGLDRTIKDIKPDAPPTPGKTGYKRIDAILGALKAAASAAGIPLGLMVGWIAKESGGKLTDTTSLDERGYFQLMPAESKKLDLDHQRLSTDSDYSIMAGVDLIQDYQKTVEALAVAPAGSSYYWKLVKLAHSMGSGQVKKVVKAAVAAGSAGSWSDLETFAVGMKINGPQPKKWFPFVDTVYAVGKPFGFGVESLVGVVNLRPRKLYEQSGLDLLGAEAV
jgi:hypothetical protein